MENISTRALVSFGISLLAVAAIIVVVILVTDEPAPVTTIPSAADTTTTQEEDTSTTSGPASSISSSTSSTSTSSVSTTTEGNDSTTTSFGVFDEAAAVEDFVLDFASAIDDGDVDFLFDRLHPAVKATYDEGECRQHIEEEILRLEDYQQAGPVEGPFDSEFGEFPLTTYEVPVTFTFEESDFESSASYSLTEGTVRWFAMCDQ